MGSFGRFGPDRFPVGSFYEFASLESSFCSHRWHQVGCIHRLPSGLGQFDEPENYRDSESPEQSPYVPRYRSQTVAKSDSIGSVVRR